MNKKVKKHTFWEIVGYVILTSVCSLIVGLFVAFLIFFIPPIIICAFILLLGLDLDRSLAYLAQFVPRFITELKPIIMYQIGYVISFISILGGLLGWYDEEDNEEENKSEYSIK